MNAWVTTHGTTFAVALAVGAVVALGLRSTFAEPREARQARTTTNADEAHHEQPGHGSHGHDEQPKADETAPKPLPEDDHRGHTMPPDPAPDDPRVGETAAPGSAGGGGGVLLDLGNTECPVMGGAVNGELFSEWNGLRVGHCCAGCQERFLKNPEALLDTVSPAWREAAAAVARIEATEGEARAAALAAAAKKWTVIREPTSGGDK